MTTAVVVTYNSARWIDRCLESLRGTPTVVVDNASVDDTATLVRERHPEVQLIQRSSNGGFAVAMNEGARTVPDDDILLFNPDAVSKPEAVATLESYLRAHPRVGIVVPRLLYPDGTRQDNVRTFPNPLTMLARRSPLGRTGFGRRILRDHYLHARQTDVARPIPATIAAVMLARRQAIDQVGPMDERIFLYGEDVDWCYRMWSAGWEIHLEPGAVMEHEYERQSRRTLDFRSLAVRQHWIGVLKVFAFHPGLLVGRVPAGARAAAQWQPPTSEPRP